MINTSEFIGCTKKSGQDLCERKNLIFYLLKIDDEVFLPLPQDKRDDRICVEIEQGKIVKVLTQ